MSRQSKKAGLVVKRPDMKKIEGLPYRLWDRYQTKESAKLEADRLKRKWRNTVVPGKPGRVVAVGGVKYKIIENMQMYPPIELWVWFHPKSKLTRATGHKRLR